MIHLISRRARFAAIVCFAQVVASYSVSPGEEKRFDWMPAEGVAANLLADESGGLIIPEIVVTKTPKATADLSKFTKLYTIDLKKFGIHNDGTHPVETSTGLNQALQDAQATGANHIVFPKGTYLISETIPLEINLKNMVIDLNGATLQINTNGLPKYGIIEFIHGAENVRLTNGTLRGDKDVHDFKAAPGTHEWGAGIHFVGGRHLEVDHITSCNMTGDGVSSTATGSRNRDELLKLIKYSIFPKEVESGAFDAKGNKIADATKVRTIKPYDATKCGGRFEIGYLGGYMGYPFIKGRVYQAYFYDADMKFLSMHKCLQYRKVIVPTEAKWMNVVFNQPEISEEPAHVGAAKGWAVRITNCHPSTDVHFHHNVMLQNRRLGMAYCGGQQWLIEDNLFAENGGTNPGYGVDLEDGSEMMQDVIFRNNKFKGNRNGDLVVCAGSEMIFEGNDFEKSVIVWGRAHNYVFRNNDYRGGNVHYTTRTGIASIHDNRYENCKLAVTFDTKAVADGLVRKAGQTVATPPLKLENEKLTNVATITGTYFYFSGCDIRAAGFIAGKETRLIKLQNCKVAESSIQYEADGPDVFVAIDGKDGRPAEAGPGLSRKKVAP